jgi:hypothetical protein
VGAAEALGGSVHDDLKHTVGIFVQLPVPNPDYRPSFSAQELIPAEISRRIGMLAAIELDYQLSLTSAM